jgi:hypothetical protein
MTNGARLDERKQPEQGVGSKYGQEEQSDAVDDRGHLAMDQPTGQRPGGQAEGRHHDQLGEHQGSDGLGQTTAEAGGDRPHRGGNDQREEEDGEIDGRPSHG